MNDSGPSRAATEPRPIAPTAGAPASLFPLEVTPFEGFMLADDRPGYPMILAVEVHLLGVLDRPAFERAFAESVARHPLFTARIERVKGWPRWVAGPGDLPKFDWCGNGTLAGLTPSSPFDLEREPGLRCWVRALDGRVRILWQFSHVSTDGVGAMQFLEDFLTAYALALPGDHFRPELRPIDPQQYRARDQYGAEPDPQAKPPGWRDYLRTLREAITFLRQKPIPLAPPKVPGTAEGGDSLSGIAMARFTDVELRALRSAAMKAESTLNDYLMALLFQTLIEWNRAQGSLRPSDLLRLLMPMNLRRRAHQEMPAANLTGFAFLEKQVGQCEAFAPLVEAIRGDTRALKRLRAGESFIRGIGALLGLRGVLPWILRRKRCLSTAVLTNLADPTQLFRARFPRRDGRALIGNLELENFSGFTANRPLTRASFAVTTYANTLVFSSRCDPQLFTLGDAQNLVDLFRARALRAIEEGQSQIANPS